MITIYEGIGLFIGGAIAASVFLFCCLTLKKMKAKRG